MESIKEELICCVCLETYRKPIVMLPCGHNLCELCVNQLPENYYCQKSCPNCRAKFVIESQGLPRNLTLENIIEKLQKLPDTTTKFQLGISSFEMEQTKQLAIYYTKDNKCCEAKLVFDNLLANVEGAQKLKMLIEVSIAFTETKSTENIKEFCNEAITYAYSCHELSPYDCNLIITSFCDLSKLLALSKENMLGISCVKCCIKLSNHIPNANVRIIKLHWIANVMTFIAQSMSKNKKQDFLKHGMPLLSEIRIKIRLTPDASQRKKCEYEAWILKHTGVCFHNIGSYQKAIDMNSEAISLMIAECGYDARLYKVFGICYYFMGAACHKLRQYEKANIHFMKANDIYLTAIDWLSEERKNESIALTTKCLSYIYSRKM